MSKSHRYAEEFNCIPHKKIASFWFNAPGDIIAIKRVDSKPTEVKISSRFNNTKDSSQTPNQPSDRHPHNRKSINAKDFPPTVICQVKSVSTQGERTTVLKISPKTMKSMPWSSDSAILHIPDPTNPKNTIGKKCLAPILEFVGPTNNTNDLTDSPAVYIKEMQKIKYGNPRLREPIFDTFCGEVLFYAEKYQAFLNTEGQIVLTKGCSFETDGGLRLRNLSDCRICETFTLEETREYVQRSTIKPVDEKSRKILNWI